MTSTFGIPRPLESFFLRFPLHTWPASPHSSVSSGPTLWIAPPPKGGSLLSADVGCLKWQVYLALRGISDIALRSDISPEGGVNGILPTLHLPNGDLLGATRLPAWADALQEKPVISPADDLEGFKTIEARDESRAWASLLQGIVHSTIAISKPPSPSLADIIQPPAPDPNENLAASLYPPPPPLSGLSTLLPPSGLNIPSSSVFIQYREAISAIADRLGKDTWFLGSLNPTSLDALLFTYLLVALRGPDTVRLEVKRRSTLVAWAERVEKIVEDQYR